CHAMHEYPGDCLSRDQWMEVAADSNSLYDRSCLRIGMGSLSILILNRNYHVAGNHCFYTLLWDYWLVDLQNLL
ncbi:MAG TPA: hypothetical protein VKZ78_06145, partial [Sphingobacteriaceae bacterium]|nr:hypothetical protein [Sphingobacteriaceae bacterium]